MSMLAKLAPPAQAERGRARRRAYPIRFLGGKNGSGKSATLNNLLNQVTAIYRPRLFIVEAGNSFGLFGEFAARLGLSAP